MFEIFFFENNLLYGMLKYSNLGTANQSILHYLVQGVELQYKPATS